MTINHINLQHYNILFFPSTSLLAHLLSPIFTNTLCITNKYKLLHSFTLCSQVFPKLYLASAAYAQSTSSKLKGRLLHLNDCFLCASARTYMQDTVNK